MSGNQPTQPDRNLAMELVRATEVAALAAARWMGRGDKIAADQAAVDGLRTALATIEMDGIVVIGEGEKDEAPMLYIGEEVGKGKEPRVDIAVDPVEGTRLLSNGMPNAISVVALSERGTMHYPAKIAYMEKLATGPEAAGAIDIERPLKENLERVAKAKGMGVRDLTVVVLDRPRHAEIVEEIRAAGARIKFITDGDVAGSLMAAMPDTGLDLLVGIGGATEGTISACALKCMGGNLQSRIWPRNDEERQLIQEMNLDVTKVYGMDDLVSSNNVFFAATGITDGELVAGVHYSGTGVTTESLVMRSKSGTIRRVSATHRLDKLGLFAATRFD
ncbi:MAG TPA: class II fructose-bisphosphatase [Thermomicrobiales bacterium]|nr:class II fructose-bisphosphatase [Thermomicrobiales bacterium]